MECNNFLDEWYKWIGFSSGVLLYSMRIICEAGQGMVWIGNLMIAYDCYLLEKPT